MDNQEPARPEDRPTSHAEMTITVGPDHRWGFLRGIFPADQAHHFITAFSIFGCVGAGIAGAVLTLRTPSLTHVAYAELALALTGMLLLAACSFARPRQEITGAPQAGEPSSARPATPALETSSPLIESEYG